MTINGRKRVNHALELKYTFSCNLADIVLNKEKIPTKSIAEKYNISYPSLNRWLSADYLIQTKEISTLPKEWDINKLMLDQSHNGLTVQNQKDKKVYFLPNYRQLSLSVLKMEENINLKYFKRLITDYDIYCLLSGTAARQVVNLTNHALMWYKPPIKEQNKKNLDKDYYNFAYVNLIPTIFKNDISDICYETFKEDGRKEPEYSKYRILFSKAVFGEYSAVEAVHVEQKNIEFQKEPNLKLLPRVSISNTYHCETSNILKYMRVQNMTYTDLGKAIGLGERKIRAWFYQNRPVSYEQAEAIANYFQCDINNLMYDIGNNYVSIFDNNDLSNMYQDGYINKRNRIAVNSLSSEDFPTNRTIAVYNFNDKLTGFEIFKDNVITFMFTDIGYVKLLSNYWYLELLFNKETKEMEIKWVQSNIDNFYVEDDKFKEDIKPMSTSKFYKKYNRFGVMIAFDYFYNVNSDLNKFYRENISDSKEEK